MKDHSLNKDEHISTNTANPNIRGYGDSEALQRDFQPRLTHICALKRIYIMYIYPCVFTSIISDNKELETFKWSDKRTLAPLPPQNIHLARSEKRYMMHTCIDRFIENIQAVSSSFERIWSYFLMNKVQSVLKWLGLMIIRSWA